MQISINSEFTNFYNGVDSSSRAVAETFTRDYFSPLHDKKYKIVLLGTSQTWGSGASRRETTIEGQLNRMISSGGFADTAQVFALAVSGSKLLEMKDLFYKTVKSQFPDMVVLNFGVNDGDHFEDFKKNLEAFALELKKNKIRVFISAEPRFGDFREFKYDDSYSEIAERTGSLFLNSGEYIDSKRNSGYICWDAVHFSDYGQRLVAEQMFDKIKFEIPVKRKYLANKN